ncbi:sulfatase-like hydrolase/transferase [bacterium]|nr:sulfatase-like hydrolase/transferase [bacterium]
MQVQNRSVLFLLVLLSAVSAAAWILYYKTTQKYHRGNLFELLELARKAEAIHPESGKQRKEKLQKGWVRVAVLNKDTEVWKTGINFAASPVPKLFSENLDLIHQNDVFQRDTPPGRWTWNRNRIWVTISAGENPTSRNYSIEYKPDPNAKLSPLRENLKQIDFLDPLTTSSRMISLFKTRHSIFPCSGDGRMRVQDGSNKVEYASGLLLDPNISSGWSYVEPARFSLLKTSKNNPFKMYGRTEVYTNARYYTAGMVRWKFTAAGYLAGHELPRLVISIDNKKIGTVKPKSREYQSYFVQTFLNEGFHNLHAQFVNDYYDEKRKLDRNVLLSHVDVEYLPLVLIASPSRSGSDRNYQIEYCTLDRTEPFVELADPNGYVRESLLFPADSQIAFRVRLPQRPRLSFGIHSLFGKNPDLSMQFRVTAKPLVGSTRELFSHKVTSQNNWLEQSIDLSEFSSRFVELSFEASSNSGTFADAQSIAVSNPIIFSEEVVPPKQIQHIFIVSADALRADHLGCYGYARPTSPDIDLFSKDAVIFENAISPGAATMPSTASLFTSVYPSTHKCDYNTSRLPAQFLTLPEVLDNNGYLTAGFVQNEFLNPPHGLADGFRWYRYDTFPMQSGKRLNPVLEWIQNMRQFPKFVFFHMLHPHSPYVPPPEIAQIFNVTHSPLASSNQKLVEVDAKRIILPPPERDHLMLLYDAEIRRLDTLFASFIQHLKQLKIYEEALIIFISDHGEAFQEHGRLGHGSNLYQEMIRVPLLIKLPSRYNARGIKIRQNVQTMDLMPTLLELSGIPIPDSLQGKSLMPLIKNSGKEENERTVFSEVLSGKQLCAIQGDYKYIHYGAAKREELYDIRVDPGETQNLFEKRLDLLEMFRKERDAFFHRASEWRKKHIQTEGEHIVLDEQQTEELKALGYIQE